MKKNNFSKIQLFTLLFIAFFSFGLKAYYDYYWPKAEVRVNGHVLKVLVADNIKHWTKGLGGREDLSEYDGMLFLFPTVQQHVFVMRDMRFSIDIIWIKNGQVVDIAPEVPLDSVNNEADLTPYAARDASGSVLELKSGMAKYIGLKIGDRVEVFR